VRRTFDEAELSAELGQCLRDLGRAEDAAQDAGRMTGRRSGTPGGIGSTGAVRSSAWICGFSSDVKSSVM
jgi:hypothetical protein